MADAYVVEVYSHTAGIVVREQIAEAFHFFAATPAFIGLEGQEFQAPHAAAHAARKLLTQQKRRKRRETKE